MYLNDERITTDDARLIGEFLAERRAAVVSVPGERINSPILIASDTEAHPQQRHLMDFPNIAPLQRRPHCVRWWPQRPEQAGSSEVRT